MLKKDTEFRLDHAMTDVKVGDQVSARLISVTPANAAAAAAVLKLLDRSAKMKASIAERLIIGMAGDAAGKAGKEMGKKINGMVDVLAAQAASASLVASKAAMGSDHMSNATFECLVHSLASRSAAIEFKAAYNKMIDVVQAIV
jgi:hypothetical protein